MRPKKRNWFLPRTLVMLSAVSLAVAAVLFTMSSLTGRGLYDQKAAEIWENGNEETRFTQVSVYMGRGAGLSYNAYMELGYNVQKRIEEEGMTGAKEDTRLWAGAGSASGTTAVASGNRKVAVTATGVLGDYFFLHRPEMLSGQSLNALDPSENIIMLDWETAWDLFHSYDIVDKSVEIGGVNCIVVGVFKKDADDTVDRRVFIRYSVYERVVIPAEMSTFEVVLPNPVGGFGKQIITELITAPEEDRVIVENRVRFRRGELLSVVLNLNGFINQTKSIALPYWENRARVATMKAALLLLAAIIFTVPSALCAVIAAGKLYNRRGKLVPLVKKGLAGFGNKDVDINT